MRAVFTTIALLVVVLGFSQESVLDSYIKEALESNLSIIQKKSQAEKAEWEFRESKGLFMPSLSFNARYTVAHGGRSIDIPVGNMLNGVYYTLHQISSKMNEYGLTDQIFPDTSLENQAITFLRPREHETKLQLIQPLFSPKIYFNYKIRREMLDAYDTDIRIAQRLIVAEVKKAYFNYLKALELQKLVENTMDLADENIRVNESLFANDKVTVDAVYRSKAEKEKLVQKAAEAERYERTASAYFNYLLNRSFEELIQVDENILIPFDQDSRSEVLTSVSEREELQFLEALTEVQDQVVKLNKYNSLPNLVAVVDYGFQGEKYRFTNKDDFAMASLVLKWDLFSGLQNYARIQQSKVDRLIMETQLEDARAKINLQVIDAFYDLEASVKSQSAAKAQTESAEKAFNIVNKQFSQGMVNMLQFLDARNTMTMAQENQVISRYEMYIKYADYEKAAALYKFDEE